MTTDNYFRDVPSKKMISSTYFDNILPIIIKNNNIFELQGFLKHNDFACKSTNKFKIAMLINYNKSIRNKKDNSYGEKKKENNCSKSNNHFIFTRIFSFSRGSFEFEQTLFHSCLSFPNFLCQVIHLYKFDQANLIETNLRLM